MVAVWEKVGGDVKGDGRSRLSLGRDGVYVDALNEAVIAMFRWLVAVAEAVAAEGFKVSGSLFYLGCWLCSMLNINLQVNPAL